MSVIDQLKKLEEQAGKLRVQAKREAMAAVKAALAGLNSLGYSYGLAEHGVEPSLMKKRGRPPGSSKTATRKRDPKKLCPVCQKPGHDARRHRWEKKKKS